MSGSGSSRPYGTDHRPCHRRRKPRATSRDGPDGLHQGVQAIAGPEHAVCAGPNCRDGIRIVGGYDDDHLAARRQRAHLEQHAPVHRERQHKHVARARRGRCGYGVGLPDRSDHLAGFGARQGRGNGFATQPVVVRDHDADRGRDGSCFAAFGTHGPLEYVKGACGAPWPEPVVCRADVERSASTSLWRRSLHEHGGDGQGRTARYCFFNLLASSRALSSAASRFFLSASRSILAASSSAAIRFSLSFKFVSPG
ncbi:MAG TPA: hypothetical protein VJ816_09355 [Gemmatimonadales bacterium]|nr:hypothetical protein [Gemmatimonadales bacterium]